MMYGLLLLSGLTGVVRAAPVGSPIADPDAGRVQIASRVGVGVHQETDGRCTDGDCGATWRTRDLSGVVDVAIVRGVGVYGELGRRADAIAEARYNGRATSKAAGLQLAVPVSQRVWIAVDGRFSFSDGTVRDKDDVESPAVTHEEIHTVTLLGTVGRPSDGGHMWFGIQGAWQWNHQLWPMGRESEDVTIEVPLTPTIPATGVLGAELTSDPLGLPWRAETRMHLGVEARGGQDTGLGLWLGLSL